MRLAWLIGEADRHRKLLDEDMRALKRHLQARPARLSQLYQAFQHSGGTTGEEFERFAKRIKSHYQELIDYGDHGESRLRRKVPTRGHLRLVYSRPQKKGGGLRRLSRCVPDYDDDLPPAA